MELRIKRAKPNHIKETIEPFQKMVTDELTAAGENAEHYDINGILTTITEQHNKRIHFGNSLILFEGYSLREDYNAQNLTKQTLWDVIANHKN